MISACIPTYKGVKLIQDSLKSVLAQTYTNFEVIICNDSPDDNEDMERTLLAYQDPRIAFYKNPKNLGYPGNLRKCVDLAKNDIVFLLGQDDIVIDPRLFEKILQVFEKNPDVGVITRPYYWFDKDPKIPNRVVPLHPVPIISKDSKPADLVAVIETVGQLSALVYKKSLITHAFNDWVFVAHIYPFMSILRTHKCYYWPEFCLAVRTGESQTIHKSTIYNPSPTWTWVRMFQDVFARQDLKHIQKIGINHICQNYVGLVQIKNYGYFKDLVKDWFFLLRYRIRNLLSLRFWFYTFTVFLTPRVILRKLVIWYKRYVIERQLRSLLTLNKPNARLGQ